MATNVILIFVIVVGVILAGAGPVSYTHLRAHETDSYLVCRLLLEKKKTNTTESSFQQFISKYSIRVSNNSFNEVLCAVM